MSNDKKRTPKIFRVTLEVSNMTPAVGPVEELLANFPAGDAEQSLLELFDAFSPIVTEQEVSMRTALRAYLDTWLENQRKGIEIPVREGRRMRWLDQALSSVRPKLTRRAWRRLRSALALTMGIDALVVMKDVCHLENDEALATLRWTATSLLRAALEES